MAKLTSQKKDFSAWYNEVIKLADLADYGPVKGTMIIKPYGYSIWENIQSIFDRELKNDRVNNAYFPMFIPEKFLKKEKEHVEGFSPELTIVNFAGGEKLEEPIVIRPTSETIIYDTFSRWINSYRDLPYRINQWCNVVRWEKRTKPFLRTSEFLWQEGHTVHETVDDADKETLKRITLYENFFKENLALPMFIGKKSESEKFAGALYSTSCEALLKDGKALQSATSHNLGQNFSKAFKIQFENREGKREFAWQTSWGFSTRVVGALIMTHGDDFGLVLPPKIAPIQIIVIPIYKNEKEKEIVKKFVDKFVKKTGNVRGEIDNRENVSPGWKFTEWEVKGVPLRVEIGPKDVEKNQVTLVKRTEKEKFAEKLEKVNVKKILDEIQEEMLRNAEKFKTENTHIVENFSQFKKDLEIKKGFFLANWCGDAKCEEEIKEKTKATTRVIPFDQKVAKKEACFHCGDKAAKKVYFAKAY